MEIIEGQEYKCAKRGTLFVMDVSIGGIVELECDQGTRFYVTANEVSRMKQINKTINLNWIMGSIIITAIALAFTFFK